MAASAASITAVQKAYVAYYGRPADPEGLTYWSERLDSIEGEFTNMIEDFGSSDEATALFGSLGNDEKINTIFQQIFGRDADAEGLAFYSDALTAGTMSAVTIAQNIIDGASGDDATIVANKLTAAQAFTDYLSANGAENYTGNSAAEDGRDWLGAVDATTASVTAASDAIATVVDALDPAPVTPSNPGSTFTLTMAEDELVGGSGDDVFNGTSLQIDADDDQVDGGAGYDTLNISVKSTFTAMSVNSIEELNLTVETFNTVTVDADDFNDIPVMNLSAGTGFANSITVSSVDSMTVSTGANLSAVTLDGFDGGVINAGAALRSLTLDAVDTNEAEVNLSSTGNVALNEITALDDLVVNKVGGVGQLTLEATSAGLTGDVYLSGGATLIGGVSAFVGATIEGAAGNKISLNADRNDGTATIDVEDWNVLISVDNPSANFINAAGKSFELTTASVVNITTDNDGGAFNVSIESTGASSSLTKGASAELMNVVISAAALSVQDINATSGDTAISITGNDNLMISNLSAGDISSLVSIDHDGTGLLSISSSTISSLDATSSTGRIAITLEDATANEFYGGAGNDTITIGTNATSTATNTVYAGDGNDTIVLTRVNSSTDSVGDFYVNGGAGNDTFSFASAGPADFTGGGNAVASTDGNLVIIGGDGTDTISFGYSGGSVNLLTGFGSGASAWSGVTITGVEVISSLNDLNIMGQTISGQTIELKTGSSSGDALLIENARGSAALDLSGITYTNWDSVSVDLSLSTTAAGTSLVATLSSQGEVVNGVDHDTGRDGFNVNLGAGADTYVAATAGGTLTLGAGADVVDMTAAGATASTIDYEQLDEHLKISDFNPAEDRLDFTAGAVAVLAAANVVDVSALTVTPTNDVVTVYLSGGMVTLGGGGVENVDTLTEWVNIALAAASSATAFSDVVGFQFDGSTWIIEATVGALNQIVELEGVVGVNLGLTRGSNVIDIDG